MSKRFGGVIALHDASFACERGEIHALLGGNGAGKSTLVKVLCGVQPPDDGVITFQGMQDHTADSIKSLEGFKRAWVEEAQTLSTTSLALLRPTIRAPGSELWFSWNPRRKTDPVDAHSVAVAALRAKGLRQVAVDDETVALRLLVDRRDELGRTRTDLLNRIHKLLLELIPGGAKTFLSADQPVPK